MNAVSTRSFDPPCDVLLPGIAEFGNPERMLEVCSALFEASTDGASRRWQHCTPTEAIYQPGRACRIAYQLDDGSDNRPELIYARWARRWRPHASGLQAGTASAPFEVFRYPRDRRMRVIRSMHREDWLRRASRDWIAAVLGDGNWATDGWRCSPIKYVPESRLICRLKGAWSSGGRETWIRAYVRMTRQNDVQDQASRLRMLAAQEKRVEFQVPRVYGELSTKNLLATEFVRGVTFREACREGARLSIDEVCPALARIGIASVGGWSSREDAVASSVMLSDLALASGPWQPSLAGLAAWGRELPAPPERSEWVHGDLHAGQIILKHGRIWIVDWDRCGMGDPTQDITNLAAEFDSRDVISGQPLGGEGLSTACLAAWRRAGGGFNPNAAAWWAARAYILRAWGLMRHLRPGWQEAVQRLIERVENVYRGRCDWLRCG